MLVVEHFPDLRSAEMANQELAVPGLSKERFGCVAVMRRGNQGTQLFACMETACADVLTAQPDSLAWGCTLVSFEKHLEKFITAGWVSRSAIPADTTISFPTLLWAQMPPVGGRQWQGFWDALSDLTYTNVLVMDAAGSVPPMPPAIAVAPPQKGISTLLEWPWAGGATKQMEWMGRVQSHIRLLALGVCDCDLGIQIVVPADKVHELDARICAVASQ